MVLPGIQALFGFQLIAVFNERFKELTEDEQLIHFSAVLVTIAIALIMTPAAYHRLAEQTTISMAHLMVDRRGYVSGATMIVRILIPKC
jgi:hypothetical protein